MGSADSLDREENSMEVCTCISKPHAIFIFYLARASIERVSSDRRRRPQLDIQQLVTWPQQGSRGDTVPIVEPIRPPCRSDGNERWLGESIFGDVRVDSDWSRNFLGQSLDLVSAWVVPQLRLLHLLQVFIHVVIVILARPNSVWGFGAGVTIWVVWKQSSPLRDSPHAGRERSHSGFSAHTGQAPAARNHDGDDRTLRSHHCLRSRLFHQTTEDRKWWKFVGGGAWTSYISS